jgi:hypothetical protein
VKFKYKVYFRLSNPYYTGVKILTHYWYVVSSILARTQPSWEKELNHVIDGYHACFPIVPKIARLVRGVWV